ncbi:MAG TPA: hypothetical protein VNY51_08580 [Candidatus Dormibacteraeota bacterium]|nr:hypothetical protein [Candidatus Dormibacteraeota bacterium]
MRRLRGRAFRAWPWFFAYVTFAVDAGVARLVTHSHPRPYFVTYWLTDAGHAVLGALSDVNLTCATATIPAASTNSLTRWLTLGLNCLLGT